MGKLNQAFLEVSKEFSTKENITSKNKDSSKCCLTYDLDIIIE